jgi:hypothetical protein
MLQSNRKGGPRVGSSRGETRPFVPDTVRISGLSVPVGGTPSQARGTPLPKPAVDLKPKKQKRESSLLGLVVPRFGRKKTDRAPAPPARSTTPLFRPDPTLEVSQSDLLLDSSTQELELADISVSDASQSVSLSPAQRYSRSRRHGPWVVWGLVGGAWCVMIALALLAVDDSSKSTTRTAGVMRVTQEQSAMAAVTVAEPLDNAPPKLATSAPSAPAVKASSDGVKPEPSVGALNPASMALVDDEPAVESGEGKPAKRERAAVKKRSSKKKLKAQYQKRKKHKKSRHHSKRAHKG